jgi:hypothetical protein
MYNSNDEISFDRSLSDDITALAVKRFEYTKITEKLLVLLLLSKWQLP